MTKQEINAQLSKAQRVPTDFESAFDELKYKIDSSHGIFAQMKIICQPDSSREAELIQHIKHLQYSMSLILPELPNNVQEWLIATVQNSKEFLKIAEE